LNLIANAERRLRRQPSTDRLGWLAFALRRSPQSPAIFRLLAAVNQ
jgi:hypothetical protein